jgi:hypothetical protein
VSKGCGFVCSKIKVENTILSPKNDSRSNQILRFQILTKSGIMIMELLVKSIPMWMNVLESHYLNYSQNISFLPSYFFSSNDVSLNSPSSYELQHSIQFTIQDMKYEIPLTLYDSVEELTEIFMKLHQLPKQYKIMILNKLYYEQNKMFQLVFQSYTHLENEKNYFFLQFLQMEEKAFLSEMHSNQVYEYIQSIENVLPLIQQKLSIAEVNRREQKEREMNDEHGRDDEEDEEMDDEEHDQLEEHFPHLSLPPHLHKSGTSSSVAAAAAVQPNLEFHKLSFQNKNENEITSPKNKKRPPSPASYNLSNSKTQNWKVLYEQSMNDLKETKKEKEQLSKDLQYHLNNSVKSQQIQQLTMENQSFKELTTSMKAEILSLQEQIGDIQKSAIQAVKQLQREQQQQQHHGKDEEKDENDPRSKPDNNNKYDQDDHEEADYSRDMFEIYKEHQQKTLSFASPLSSPSISPRAMSGGNQNNINTSNRNSQIHKTTSSSSLIGPSLDDHQDFDEWKKLPFDKRDWTVNYYDLIFNPSYSLQENSLHLFSLFHSLRWPFIEEFLFTIIYQHYSVPTKGGVTLTSFIRFTKDFNIFMNFNGTPFSPASMTSASAAAATTEQLMYGTNTTSSGSVLMNQLNTNSETYNDILAMSMQSRFRSSSASHSPMRAGVQPTTTITSASHLSVSSPFLTNNRQPPPFQPLELMSAAPTHVTMEPGLSNGEISLIFTNVSRLETDDALKKTQTPVFKVRSVFTPNTINITEAIVGSPISTSSKKGGGILSPVVTLSSPNLSKKINTKNTTAVVNSSSVTNNTIISRKQFILALQEMANKLYCNVIEMAMGNILPSGGRRDLPTDTDLEEEEEKKMKKQKEVERVAMELFLMKVVVPSVVNLGKLSKNEYFIFFLLIIFLL